MEYSCTKYDAIIIGTGQANPSTAVRLASTGMEMAIIEKISLVEPVLTTAVDSL